ncbi:MAG: GGDEF-domain containing protein [Herminiimonas sp.]|nr:GGDEF-domain containing protein [Herminiimonas sp.]
MLNLPALVRFPTGFRNLLARKEHTLIWGWPIGAAALIGALWLRTVVESDGDRADSSQLTSVQVTSLANSYAEQLRHTVDQINYLLLDLKYDSEDPGVVVSIEKKQAHGLYPNSTRLYVSVASDEGIVTSSSLQSNAWLKIEDARFFQMQKAGCCSGLLVTGPEVSQRTGAAVIHFSRRINKADGSFGGIALVTVAPSYLTSFQDDAVLGRDDFVSLRSTSGVLLASKTRSGSEMYSDSYRSPPTFPTPSGIEGAPAERFKDGQARVVAWKQLELYPLVAVAGLAERDAFAGYRTLMHSRVQMAILGSVLLASCAAVGMSLSAKLAYRRRREEEVRSTYRVATDAANEGFYMIRPRCSGNGEIEDFILEDCNERGAALIGKSRADIIGSRASQLLPKAYREEVVALCRRALESGLYEDEVRVSPRSPLKAAWVYRRMVRSAAGLAFTLRDISEAKAHDQALASLANSDELTKLPNRHWLATFLPTALKNAANRNGLLAILFIDLDNFKNINDSLGHEAGDELLKHAAVRLKGAVRASDHVVRLGGDEFTVILEQLDTVEDVDRVARGIIGAIAKPFKLDSGIGNQVTASIGISIFPRDGESGETLLKHADIAMYAAKAAGKSRHCFYQGHLSDSLLLRLSKERALRCAVEEDQFVVHYQPRVGARSGKLTSMEALVRWIHPELGLIYPTDFIGLAEDAGLIIRIGELVIGKVCRQLSLWRSEGVGLVPVSINVAPQQLRFGRVSTTLAGCLAQYGIEASLIEVELTESAVIDRSEAVSTELTQLRALGIKLLIDDFGTGYSSLAQLQRLDVDGLKVDQAFTRALSDGEEAEILFQAIVSMAGALHMCVTAEGVETSQQLNVLRRLACDEIQGFLISEAVTATDMKRLLTQRFLLSLPGADRAVTST